MPISYSIDEQRLLVTTTLTGRINFQEWTEFHGRLRADPRFQPEFAQLIDATAVRWLNFSREQFTALAKNWVFSIASRHAAVATDPAVFGLLRVFETHFSFVQSGACFGVFHHLEPALSWLATSSRRSPSQGYTRRAAVNGTPDRPAAATSPAK